METGHAEVRTLPVGRAHFFDDQGTLLRATWHLDKGFVNFSVWRTDTCIVTFHLAVEDSARLITFLVEGLGEATSSLLMSRSPAPVAQLVPPVPVPGIFEQLAGAVHWVRECLAGWIKPPSASGPPGGGA